MSRSGTIAASILGLVVPFSLRKIPPIIKRVFESSSSSLTVLSYHRVIQTSGNSFELWPDVATFRQQIKWLKTFGQLIDLEEAITRACVKGEPGRFCAISFDDGYLDNYEIAVPTLIEENATATFFIATSYLAGKAMFNDVVFNAFLKTNERFIESEFIGREKHSLELNNDRRNLAIQVIEKLKYLDPEIRDGTAIEIANKLKVEIDSNLMMSHAHVADLKAKGMGVGSHTHRHLVATTVAPEVFAMDVKKSIEVLESITGKKPMLFAFPNGKSNVDQTDTYVSLVKEFGFKAAMTTDLGSNFFDSDLFALKRFTPWATNRFGFVQQLRLSSVGAYND